MECRALALLSLLVAALFLLADALPFDRHASSRLRGPGAALADALLAALDRLRGVDLPGLATRRNMVLLCHAILLLVLRDAGLLGGTPPARTTDDHDGTLVLASASCSPPERPLSRSVVVWRSRKRAAENAPVLDDVVCRLERQSLAEAEQAARPHESTKEVVLVEDQTTTYVDGRGGLRRPAAPVDCGTTIPSALDFGGRHTDTVLADDGDTDRAEKNSSREGDLTQGYVEEEEEEDLDEMNRRFAAFIADTKEKMRLEALLQPLHV